MKLDPPKYTLKELEMFIGQECTILYYGDKFKGTLKEVYGNGSHDMVHVDMVYSREAFFIERVIAVPLLDKLRTKRLWNLIK